MKRKGRMWLGSVVLACALGRAEGANAYDEAYDRAKEMERAGKWREAEKAFEEALGKQGPKHFMLKVAEMRVKQGRGEDALREVEAYRGQEPGASRRAQEQAAKIEGQARALIAGKKARTKEVASEPKKAAAPRPEMVRIEAGTFLMGSPETEAGRDSDERQHQVTISKPYLMAKTEVTQGQYEAVMGRNPASNEASKQHPVETVSFYDAAEYCNKLSEKERLPVCYEIGKDSVSWPQGLKCRGYRLPTEAEWEYAARAGKKTLYAGSNEVEEVAWTSGGTHAVGGKRANAWGLHDMSGNVWEWVWDWEGEYPAGPVADPVGPGSGSGRVGRGGSIGVSPRYLRVASRIGYSPGNRGGYLGFRVARSLP